MLRRTSPLLHIGSLSEGFQDFKNSFPQFQRAVVVADVNTRRHCLPILENLTDWKNVPVFEMPAGEGHKNLNTCQLLWHWMLDQRLDRHTLIVLLGGGVVGDTGGFCAATFKRGLPFVQVPTSLLAMTDAAIGGKLGVDFQGFKNIVGIFRQPLAVLCDPIFLRTLPPRELASGWAEVIKHAIIGDPQLLRFIQNLQHIPSPYDSVWIHLLKKSVAVKTSIVRRDPEEQLGWRALLNFGHTIGHALESFFLHSHAPILHGEAVAAGMICESFLQANSRVSDRVALIFRFFDKIDIPDAALPAILNAMLHDKKNLAHHITMTLPTDGKGGYEIITPGTELIMAAIQGYRNLQKK